MPLRIKLFHHSQPVDGYSFVIDKHTIREQKYKAVVAKIAEYRKNNGLPPGDPEHDLAAYTQKDYPWLVETRNDAVSNAGSEEALSQEYVSTVWKMAPNKQVEPNVQRDRFSKCLECPKYILLDTDSETIRKSTALASSLLRDIVKGHDHGFCEHHLWVCSVACTLQENKSLANPEVLNKCWHYDDLTLAIKPDGK